MDFANTLIAIWPKLMKYSRSLTKGNYAAEDLVMEVITKILESAERIDPNTNLEAYAIRAIKNTFLNERTQASWIEGSEWNTSANVPAYISECFS